MESLEDGTLLLDEVGELPQAALPKLLRVLASGRARRLGSVEERDVDVRFIASTSSSLKARVEAGSFREDLFYRLGGMETTVPPLRERREEIGPLAAHFLELHARRHGRRATALRDDARRLLEGQPWPGNATVLRILTTSWSEPAGMGKEIRPILSCPRGPPRHCKADLARAARSVRRHRTDGAPAPSRQAGHCWPAEPPGRIQAAMRHDCFLPRFSPWRRSPSCALLVIALPSAIAADWPQFRGPAGLGRAPEGDPPAAWTDAENVVWRTELPGPGASSAIVVGKKVFVTCYSGYGVPGGEGADPERLRRHLLCLDRETGKIAWTREVAAPLPEEQYRSYQALHGYASSTPASDGERVYVFFGKAGVLAFDLEGKELWRESVGDRTHGWGSGTSPVLHGEHVIVNASVESGSLVALKKVDGKKAWTAPGMTSSWNTPLVVEANGRPETVVSVRGRLRAFHAATGEELWNCEGIPDYVCPSVIAADGIVYAIGARSNSSLAVRAGGKGDVTQSHVVWKLSRGSNVSSPVYHEGHLYWASESRGVVYCVDAKEGKVVYEERLQPSPDRIYASALVAGGKIYYVSRTEGTYVLEAKPAFKLLARNAFTEDRSIFNATPAVCDGRLYLRSDRYLYCIGKKG